MIRPDPIGFFDILVGVLLLFTTSPIPVAVAEIHAYFLIIKGVGTVIKQVRFPLPVFVLGGAADLLSATILFTGTPPILESYKTLMSGILFLKGVLSMLSLA